MNTLKAFDIQAGFDNESRFFIVGVDEAGRGPLAGPVISAAVFLKETILISKITDSKKMSLLQREKAFDELRNKAFIGIGRVDADQIDRINILKATHLAMTQAMEQLSIVLKEQIKQGCLEIKNQETFKENFLVLIDGNSYKGDSPFKVKTVVGGDGKSLSIACASVIAKQTRDSLMEEYDRQYPQYGFKEHKGYPTKKHAMAIKEFGFCPIHRQTFRVPYL